MKKIFTSILMVLCISVSVFSQKTNYEIYALKFGSVGQPIPLSYIVSDAPEKENITPVFIFWLIKGNNGKNILVDAGFLEEAKQSKSFNVKNYVRPDLLLSKLGVLAKDVTDIILTHAHWDHMGGIDLFPNAQVWIQKNDYDYFVGEAWQKDGNKGGYFNSVDARMLLERNLAGKLTLVDGDDKEIIPGIKVLTGSRHTFDSQSVVVKSESGNIILASDNIMTYYNLEHLKPASESFTLDPAAYVKAMKRMKKLTVEDKFIIPGHDDLLFSKFPLIKENIAKIK